MDIKAAITKRSESKSLGYEIVKKELPAHRIAEVSLDTLVPSANTIGLVLNSKPAALPAGEKYEIVISIKLTFEQGIKGVEAVLANTGLTMAQVEVVALD